jgi:hypothetical protein
MPNSIFSFHNKLFLNFNILIKPQKKLETNIIPDNLKLEAVKL